MHESREPTAAAMLPSSEDATTNPCQCQMFNNPANRELSFINPKQPPSHPKAAMPHRSSRLKSIWYCWVISNPNRRHGCYPNKAIIMVFLTARTSRLLDCVRVVERKSSYRLLFTYVGYTGIIRQYESEYQR